MEAWSKATDNILFCVNLVSVSMLALRQCLTLALLQLPMLTLSQLLMLPLPHMTM